MEKSFMPPAKLLADQSFNAAGRRVLIISPGIPHPEQGASTVLFYCYIDALKKAGFKILNVLLLQPDSADDEKLAEYERRVRDREQFEVLPCWADKFVRSGRFNHTFDDKALLQIEKKVTAFQADLSVSLDLMCAWASNYLSTGRKVVWLGDLNYDSYWYNTLYGWKEGSSKSWHLVWAVAQRWSWKRIYKTVLADYDDVCVSSYSSVQSLAKSGIRSRYLPYPWPNKFDVRKNQEAPSGKPNFLFFGTLSALGSRSALHFLVEKIYPRLLQECGQGNFHINICGQREFPHWTAESISDKPEIEFLGFVDDLGELMNSCHALIAPIDVPVGNRSRILTALAARLPVIAHNNTALGNPGLIHNKTCLLASTADEFVDLMRFAAENRDEIKKIADTGYIFYESNFAPMAATSIFLREIVK